MKKISSWLLAFALVLSLGSTVSAKPTAVSPQAVEDFIATAESTLGWRRSDFYGSPYMPAGISWCGYFVGWCLNHSQIAWETGKNIDSYSGVCCNSMIWAAQNGLGTIYIDPGYLNEGRRYQYENSFLYDGAPASRVVQAYNFIPKKGDMILYDWNYSDFSMDHIGLVVSDHETIEGNSGPGVTDTRRVMYHDLMERTEDGNRRQDAIIGFFRFDNGYYTDLSFVLDRDRFTGFPGEEFTVSYRHMGPGVSVTCDIPDGTVQYRKSEQYEGRGSFTFRMAQPGTTTLTMELRDASDEIIAQKPISVTVHSGSLESEVSSLALDLEGNQERTFLLSVSGKTPQHSAISLHSSGNISAQLLENGANSALVHVTAQGPGEAQLRLELTDGNNRVLDSLTLPVSVTGKNHRVHYEVGEGYYPPQDQEKVYGEVLTLSSDIPYHAESYFYGWALSSDGPVCCQPGDLYPLDQDLTLYAVWAPSEGTPLVLDAAGGTVFPKTTETADGRCPVLPIPVWENHEFLGWYDKDGRAIQTGDALNGIDTLTAHWKVLPTLSGTSRLSICPSIQFQDLATDQWYHEGIDYVLCDGIMNGMSSTRFQPNGNLTRGQLVTVLYRMAGEPDVLVEAPYWDVSDRMYYSEAVDWAYAKGITTGVDEYHFAPEAPLTREQLVAFFGRYANTLGIPVRSSNDLHSFGDWNTVSDYAVSSMAWAVDHGILNGIDGSLFPTASASRAQIAAIIQRFETEFGK